MMNEREIWGNLEAIKTGVLGLMKMIITYNNVREEDSMLIMAVFEW